MAARDASGAIAELSIKKSQVSASDWMACALPFSAYKASKKKLALAVCEEATRRTMANRGTHNIN